MPDATQMIEAAHDVRAAMLRYLVLCGIEPGSWNTAVIKLVHGIEVTEPFSVTVDNLPVFQQIVHPIEYHPV